MVIMAPPPGTSWEQGSWKAGGWRFLLTCSFFFFSDYQGGPSTPCWGKWGEWPGRQDGGVGQRADWAARDSGLCKAELSQAQNPTEYKAAKREVGLWLFPNQGWTGTELNWQPEAEWFLEGFLLARKIGNANINSFIRTIIWSPKVLIFPVKQTLDGSLLPAETYALYV